MELTGHQDSSICKHCGIINNNFSNKFCTNCGTKFESYTDSKSVSNKYFSMIVPNDWSFEGNKFPFVLYRPNGDVAVSIDARKFDFDPKTRMDLFVQERELTRGLNRGHYRLEIDCNNYNKFNLKTCLGFCYEKYRYVSVNDDKTYYALYITIKLRNEGKRGDMIDMLFIEESEEKLDFYYQREYKRVVESIYK